MSEDIFLGDELKKFLSEAQDSKTIVANLNLIVPVIDGLKDVKQSFLHEIGRVGDFLVDLEFLVREAIRLQNSLPQQKPHKCPVCDGNGFRLVYDGKEITCKACHGRGIVWG